MPFAYYKHIVLPKTRQAEVHMKMKRPVISTTLQRFVYTILFFSIAACSPNDQGNHNKPSTPPETSALQATTIEQMVGEMLIVGFKGRRIEDIPQIKAQIQKGHLGGVLLYGRDQHTKSKRNIFSQEQVTSLTRDLQAISPHPLFIAIDEEGGLVNRLKPTLSKDKQGQGYYQVVSAQYLGDKDDASLTKRYTAHIAENLAMSGFNLNFAPVVDLKIDPNSPAIGKLQRSFSAQPQKVSKHAAIFMEEHQKREILCALKHFPGHGSSSDDTHAGFTDVSYTWQVQELDPYRKLIRSGDAKIIMTAHVFNEQLDPEYPATLSKSILQDLLRDELRFRGVIISDDMQMGAIGPSKDLPQNILQAIHAGIDILLFSNNIDAPYDPYLAKKVHQIIMDHLEAGRISEDRIKASYRRIMALKNRWI